MDHNKELTVKGLLDLFIGCYILRKDEIVSTRYNEVKSTRGCERFENRRIGDSPLAFYITENNGINSDAPYLLKYNGGTFITSLFPKPVIKLPNCQIPVFMGDLPQSNDALLLFSHTVAGRKWVEMYVVKDMKHRKQTLYNSIMLPEVQDIISRFRRECKKVAGVTENTAQQETQQHK